MFDLSDIADILKPQVKADALPLLDGLIARADEQRTRIDALNNYSLNMHLSSRFLNLDGANEIVVDVETELTHHLGDGSSIMTINVAAFSNGETPALLVGELLVRRSASGYIDNPQFAEKPTLIVTPEETYELDHGEHGSSGQSIMFALWTDYCRNLYFDVNAS